MEEAVSFDDEVLGDPPAAADAALLLEERVEGVALEGSDLAHPHRDRDLWAGAGVCLEAAETEEQHPQRRRRPNKRV